MQKFCSAALYCSREWHWHCRRTTVGHKTRYLKFELISFRSLLWHVARERWRVTFQLSFIDTTTFRSFSDICAACSWCNLKWLSRVLSENDRSMSHHSQLWHCLTHFYWHSLRQGSQKKCANFGTWAKIWGGGVREIIINFFFFN